MLINEWFLKEVFFSCFSGRNSGREKSLYDAAESGNLANVKHLLKTTYVDTTEGEGSQFGIAPLGIAGKIFFFSSSDPDPDIKSK